jgi:hypothetical protein
LWRVPHRSRINVEEEGFVGRWGGGFDEGVGVDDVVEVGDVAKVVKGADGDASLFEGLLESIWGFIAGIFVLVPNCCLIHVWYDAFENVLVMCVVVVMNPLIDISGNVINKAKNDIIMRVERRRKSGERRSRFPKKVLINSLKSQTYTLTPY